MASPWAYTGWYMLTGAYDPQAVCTAFEAEANVDECVLIGTVGEANVDVQFMAAAAAINENVGASASVSIDDNTGGTWGLTLNVDAAGDVTSGDIAWNADAATVETAVEAMSNVTSATVTGTGASATPWVITINDEAGDIVWTSTQTDLTGGTATDPTVTEIQEAVGVSATDTTITYNTMTDSWTNRSAFGTPFFVTIDSEVLEVTADSGTVLTVKRGAQGTAAATHEINTAIAFPAYTISNTGQAIFRVGSDTSVAAITSAAAALVGDGVPVIVASGFPAVS